MGSGLASAVVRAVASTLRRLPLMHLAMHWVALSWGRFSKARWTSSSTRLSSNKGHRASPAPGQAYKIDAQAAWCCANGQRFNAGLNLAWLTMRARRAYRGLMRWSLAAGAASSAAQTGTTTQRTSRLYA